MENVKQFITEKTLEGHSQDEISHLLIDFCQRNGDIPIEEAHEQLRILWEKRSLPIITEEAIEQEEIKLFQYLSEPPRYELYWADIGGKKPLRFDNIDDLWSWTTVEKTMAEQWSTIADDMKSKEWHNLMRVLLRKRKVITQPGASDAAEILDMLQDWIEDNTDTEWLPSELNRVPVLHEDAYYFRSKTFMQRKVFAKGTRWEYQRHLLPMKNLYQILGDAGGESVQKKVGNRNFRLWQMPLDFNEPKGKVEEIQGKLEVPQDDVADI